MGYNSKTSPPDHQYIKVGRFNTVNYRDTSNFDGVTFSGTGTEIAVTFDINTKCSVDAVQFVFHSPVDLGGTLAATNETSPWFEGTLANQIYAIPSNGLVQTTDDYANNTYGNSPAPPLEQWNYDHNHPIYASGGFSFPYNGTSIATSNYTFQYANNGLDGISSTPTTSNPPRLIMNRFGAHWHYRIAKRQVGSVFYYRVVVWSDDPRYNIPSTLGQDLPFLTLVFPGTSDSSSRIMNGAAIGGANAFGRVNSINDSSGNALSSTTNAVGANNLYIDDTFTQMTGGFGGIGVIGKPRDVSNASWSFAVTDSNGDDIGTGSGYDSANLQRWNLAANSASGAHDVFDIEAVALHIVGAANASVGTTSLNVTTVNARTDDDFGPTGDAGGVIASMASVSSTIEITTATNHGLTTGDKIIITGAAGGSWGNLNNTYYIVRVNQANPTKALLYDESNGANIGTPAGVYTGSSAWCGKSLWNSPSSVPDGGPASGAVLSGRHQNGLSVIDLITQRNYLINGAASGSGIVGVVPPPADLHLKGGSSAADLVNSSSVLDAVSYELGYIKSSYDYCPLERYTDWRWDASAGHVANMCSNSDPKYLNMQSNDQFVWADSFVPRYSFSPTLQADKRDRLYPNTINNDTGNSTSSIKWVNKGMGEKAFYRDSFTFFDGRSGRYLVNLQKGGNATNNTGSSSDTYQGSGGNESVPSNAFTLMNYQVASGSEFYVSSGNRLASTVLPRIEAGGVVGITVSGGPEINNSAAHNILFEAYSQDMRSSGTDRANFGIQIGLTYDANRTVPKVYATQIVVDKNTNSSYTTVGGSRVYTNTVVSDDLPTTFNDTTPTPASITVHWSDNWFSLLINGRMVALSSQNLFFEPSGQDQTNEFLREADGTVYAKYPQQTLRVSQINSNTTPSAWRTNVGGTGGASDNAATTLDGCYGLWYDIKSNVAQNWVHSHTTQRTISGISTANPAVVTTSAAHGYETGDYVKITNAAGGNYGTTLNNNVYQVVVTGSTQFSLVGVDGGNFTGTYTASSGKADGAKNWWRNFVTDTVANDTTEVISLDSASSTDLTYLIPPSKHLVARGTFNIGEIIFMTGRRTGVPIAQASISIITTGSSTTFTTTAGHGYSAGDTIQFGTSSESFGASFSSGGWQVLNGSIWKIQAVPASNQFTIALDSTSGFTGGPNTDGAKANVVEQLWDDSSGNGWVSLGPTTTTAMLTQNAKISQFDGYLKHKWSGFIPGSDSTTHIIDSNMPGPPSDVASMAHPYREYNMDIGHACGCAESWEGYAWVIEVTGGNGTWDGMAYNCQVSEGAGSLKRRIDIDPATGDFYQYPTKSAANEPFQLISKSGGTWTSVRAAGDNTAVCWSMANSYPTQPVEVYIQDDGQNVRLYQTHGGNQAPSNELPNGFYLVCGPMPNSTSAAASGRYFYVDSSGCTTDYSAGIIMSLGQTVVPPDGDQFRITATDGTTRLFEFADDSEGANGSVISGSGNSAVIRIQRNESAGTGYNARAARAQLIKEAIEHNDALAGKITVARQGINLTIRQVVAGVGGNTLLDYVTGSGTYLTAPAAESKFTNGFSYNGLGNDVDLTTAGTFTKNIVNQTVTCIVPSSNPEVNPRGGTVQHLVAEIQTATSANPPVITTKAPHGLVDGQFVVISGCTTSSGNAGWNSSHKVNVTGQTTFELLRVRNGEINLNGSGFGSHNAGTGYVTAPPTYDAAQSLSITPSIVGSSPHYKPSATANGYLAGGADFTVYDLSLGQEVALTFNGNPRNVNIPGVGSTNLGLRVTAANGERLNEGWYYIPGSSAVNFTGSTPSCALGSVNEPTSQKMGRWININNTGRHFTGGGGGGGAGNVRTYNIFDGSAVTEAKQYCNQSVSLKVKSASLSGDAFLTEQVTISSVAKSANNNTTPTTLLLSAVNNTIQSRDHVYLSGITGTNWTNLNNQWQQVMLPQAKIVDASSSGSNTVFTTDQPHWLQVGSIVELSGMTGNGGNNSNPWTTTSNGQHTVTAIGFNQFTVAFDSSATGANNFSDSQGNILYDKRSGTMNGKNTLLVMVGNTNSYTDGDYGANSGKANTGPTPWNDGGGFAAQANRDVLTSSMGSHPTLSAIVNTDGDHFKFHALASDGNYYPLPGGDYVLCDEGFPDSNGVKHALQIGANGTWSGTIERCSDSTPITIHTGAENQWYDEDLWTWQIDSAGNVFGSEQAACLAMTGTAQNLYFHGSLTDGTLKVYTDYAGGTLAPAGWYWSCNPTGPIPSGGDGPYKEPFECVGEPFAWWSSTAPGSIKELNSTKNIIGSPSRWGIEDITPTSCDLEDYDDGRYDGSAKYALEGYTSAVSAAEYDAKTNNVVAAVSGQVSNANPTIINTVAAHGLSTGDVIAFKDFAGNAWTSLNVGTYAVTVGNNPTQFSIAVDSTGFNAHTANSGVIYTPQYQPALEFSAPPRGPNRFGLARYSGARTKSFFASASTNGIPPIVSKKATATDMTIAMWVKLTVANDSEEGTIFDFRNVNILDSAVQTDSTKLSRMTLRYKDLNTATPDLILTTSRWGSGSNGTEIDYYSIDDTPAATNTLTLTTNTSSFALKDNWCLIVVKAGASGHEITVNSRFGVVDYSTVDTNASNFCADVGGIGNFSPYVGCNFLGRDVAHMSLGDLIVYDQALEYSNLQELEGYLMHKWGEQLMLAAHPYYQTGPDCVDGEVCSTDTCESQIWFKDADSDGVADVTHTSNSFTVPLVYRSTENVYGYQFTLSGTGITSYQITPGFYSNGVANGAWTFSFSDPLGQGFENYAIVDQYYNITIVGFFFDSGKANIIEKFAPADGTLQDLLSVTVTKSSTITAPSVANINLIQNTAELDGPAGGHPILVTYPDDVAAQQAPTGHWSGSMVDDSGNADLTDKFATIHDARELAKHVVPLRADSYRYKGDPSNASYAFQYFEPMDALRKGYHDVSDIVTILLHILYNGTSSATQTPLNGRAQVKEYINRSNILALPVCTERLAKTDCNPCPCDIPTLEDCLSELWIEGMPQLIGNNKDVQKGNSPGALNASAQMPSVSQTGNYAVLTIMYRSSCCIDGYWIKFGNMKDRSTNPYFGIGGVLGFVPSNSTNPLMGGETGVRKWWEFNGLDPDGNPLVPYSIFTLMSGGGAGNATEAKASTGLLQEEGLQFPVAWGFSGGKLLKKLVTDIGGGSGGGGKSYASLQTNLNATALWNPDRLGAWCLPATTDKKARILTRVIVNLDSFNGVPSIESFRLVSNDDRKAPSSYASYTWTGDSTNDANSTVGFQDFVKSIFYTWAGLSPVEDPPVGTLMNAEVDKFDAESDNKHLDVVDVLTVANHLTMHGFGDASNSFAGATSSPSSLIVPQDCCPCDTPANFTLTGFVYPCFCWEQGYDKNFAGTIRLNWTESTGAKGYKILRRGWKSSSNVNSAIKLDGSKDRAKTHYTHKSDSNREWETVHIAKPGETTWYDRNPLKPRRCCPDDKMPSSEYVIIAFNECGETVQKIRLTPKCCNRAPKANPLVLESNINQPVHFVTPVYDPDAPAPFGGGTQLNATATITIASAGVPSNGDIISLRSDTGINYRFKFMTTTTTADGSTDTDGAVKVGIQGISAGGGSGALVAAKLVSAVNGLGRFTASAVSNVVTIAQKNNLAECGNTKVGVVQVSAAISYTNFTGGNKPCDPSVEDCDMLNIVITSVSVPGGYFVGSSGLPSNNDGQFIYVPPPNYTGSIVITYMVTDSHGCRDRSTVTIRIKPPKIRIVCRTAPCNTREHGVVFLQWNRVNARVLKYEVYRKVTGAADGTYTLVGTIAGNVGGDSPVMSWRDKPPKPDECCTGSEADISYTYRVAVWGISAPTSWAANSGNQGIMTVAASYTSLQKPMVYSWECTVVIPCCPLPRNPQPDICWSDCDGTPAKVNIYGKVPPSVAENNTTITITSNAGTPQALVLTTSNSTAYTSSTSASATAGTIGTQSMTTAGHAARALWLALKDAIDNHSFAATLLPATADTAEAQGYVTITQANAGAAGNRAITNNLAFLQSPTSFQCGYDAGDHPKVLIKWRPVLASVGTVSQVLPAATTNMRVIKHGLRVGDTVSFTGFTGGWSAMNHPAEFQVAAVVDQNNITLNVNSSTYGTYTVNTAKAWSTSPVRGFTIWRKRQALPTFKRYKKIKADTNAIRWNGAEYFYEDTLKPCYDCGARYSVDYAVTATSKRGVSGNPNDATWDTWANTSKTIATGAAGVTVGATTTFNTTADHGFSTGDYVTLAVSGTGWVNLNNTTHIITVVDNNSFSIPFNSSAYTASNLQANGAAREGKGDPCSPGGETVTAGIVCCPPTPCPLPINRTECIDDTVTGNIDSACMPTGEPAPSVVYGFADNGNNHWTNTISSKTTLNTATGAYSIDTSGIAAGTYTWNVTVASCGKTGTTTFTLILEDCGCPCPDDEKDYTICDMNYIQADFTKALGLEQVPFSLSRKGGQTLRRNGTVYVTTLGADGNSED